MPSNLVFLVTVLLLSCVITMHACDARQLGTSGSRFEDQKSGIEVNVEGRGCESLFITSKIRKPQEISKGNEAIMSPISSQINSQAVEWKGIRRQVMMVELGSRDGTVDDDAVGSVDIDVGEDVVVMDYAQPHRKPPIHNEKP